MRDVFLFVGLGKAPLIIILLPPLRLWWFSWRWAT